MARRLLLIGGACTAIVLLGLFAWQKAEQSSYESDAESHQKVATTLQTAVDEGTAAGDVLTNYVATGDESLLADLQEHSDKGVRELTAAVTEADGDPNNYVQTGAEVIQRAGEVVARRQSGDIDSATTALLALSEDYTAFVQLQQETIQAEHAAAVDATDSANQAEDLARWFLAGAGGIGLAVVLGGIWVIARRIGQRGRAEVTPT